MAQSEVDLGKIRRHFASPEQEPSRIVELYAVQSNEPALDKGRGILGIGRENLIEDLLGLLERLR